ncbi:hypothetical protein ACLOJK_000139, partial [Asimina triloba]
VGVRLSLEFDISKALNAFEVASTKKSFREYQTLVGSGNSKALNSLPDSVKDWKPWFFFAQLVEPGGVDGEWGVLTTWEVVLENPPAATSA